jgi:hypothetical protein
MTNWIVGMTGHSPLDMPTSVLVILMQEASLLRKDSSYLGMTSGEVE